MNPVIAAAAWMLLSGGPPAVEIPRPTTPQPPAICPAPPGNHISVRWVGHHRPAPPPHHRRHHHG